MKLRCWGTRGSFATPHAGMLEMGGNTSCYQLELDADRALVLDCGTGLIEYASELLRLGTSAPREFHVLVSHFHWDHILGFPFFHVIHRPGVQVHLYSAFETQVLEAQFRALFDGTYSPLRDLDNLRARVVFRRISEAGIELGGTRIRCCPVQHTEPCYAMRVDSGGRSLCYVTDHDARPSAINDRVVSFVEGADLLLHDAHFTADEYAQQVRPDHSSVELALRNATAAGAKRVLLTHHHPDHSDGFLKAHLAAQPWPNTLRAELAREHMDYTL